MVAFLAICLIHFNDSSRFLYDSCASNAPLLSCVDKREAGALVHVMVDPMSLNTVIHRTKWGCRVLLAGLIASLFNLMVYSCTLSEALLGASVSAVAGCFGVPPEILGTLVGLWSSIPVSFVSVVVENFCTPNGRG